MNIKIYFYSTSSLIILWEVFSLLNKKENKYLFNSLKGNNNKKLRLNNLIIRFLILKYSF